MKAVILSIGSELLQGFLTDTNVTFLAQELGDLGVEVVGVFQVGDDLDRLTRALERALADADLVVTTGGIGPTADDLTREAVAAICGEQPRVDPDVLETVREFFTRRGATMPERNSKQAWTIPSAEILPNPNGTAPGWLVRRNGQSIVSMPGVPREMMPMWRDQAEPRLRRDLPQRSIVAQTLKTLGIGESAVEQELRAIIERGYPTVSTYAKNDGVHVRIHASSDRLDVARRAVRDAEAEIRSILGNHVYGYLDDPLPVAVLQPAVIAGETVALWEAGTGGQLGSLFMSDDAVSGVIVESRVTSLDRAKELLSAKSVLEVAQVCAREMLERSEAHYGLGVSIELSSLDDGGRHDARIAIALTTSTSAIDIEHQLAAAPLEIRRRATLLAAQFLRQSILDSR